MAAESSADDRAGVVRTALDYFEGWFDGDAARIERALHPELAKRSLGQAPSGTERLATITARQMVQAAAGGEGGRKDPGDRRIEVEVEHLHGTIANVTVRSAVYLGRVRRVPPARAHATAGRSSTPCGPAPSVGPLSSAEHRRCVPFCC
jgi:hypothetical protein